MKRGAIPQWQIAEVMALQRTQSAIYLKGFLAFDPCRAPVIQGLIRQNRTSRLFCTTDPSHVQCAELRLHPTDGRKGDEEEQRGPGVRLFASEYTPTSAVQFICVNLRSSAAKTRRLILLPVICFRAETTNHILTTESAEITEESH